MARRNISLPDDLDSHARRAGLNVSALAQTAIVAELDRQRRMASFDAWLEDLDAEYGEPSDEAMKAARAWVASAVPAPQVRATERAKAPRRARKQADSPLSARKRSTRTGKVRTDRSKSATTSRLARTARSRKAQRTR